MCEISYIRVQFHSIGLAGKVLRIVKKASFKLEEFLKPSGKNIRGFKLFVSKTIYSLIYNFENGNLWKWMRKYLTYLKNTNLNSFEYVRIHIFNEFEQIQNKVRFQPHLGEYDEKLRLDSKHWKNWSKFTEIFKSKTSLELQNIGFLIF